MYGRLTVDAEGRFGMRLMRCVAPLASDIVKVYIRVLRLSLGNVM